MKGVVTGQCMLSATCRYWEPLAEGIGGRQMSTYFTREGLALKQRQLRDQEAKVKAVGKEAGDEAGINCDWHDNFGYEDAKRRLEMASTQLARLRQELQDAKLITIQEQNDRVTLGSTVVFTMNDETKEITIGASGESDPSNGLVTYNSPLGSALIGMGPGDSKTVHIGVRTVMLEVVELFPPSYRYHQLIEMLRRPEKVSTV